MDLFSFRFPWALLLIPPAAAYVTVAYRRGIVSLSRHQRITGLVIRSILLLLIILALSVPVLRRRLPGKKVVFLVDASLSVPDASFRDSLDYVSRALKNRRGLKTAVYVFAGRAVRLDPERLRSFDRYGRFAVRELQESDIEQAVQLALSRESVGSAVRLVLLSDGRETMGDLLDRVSAMDTRHFSVDTRRVDTAAKRRDLAMTSITLPGHVRSRQNFPLTVTCASTVERRVTVKLYRDGWLYRRRTVRLRKGETRLTFRAAVPAKGLHVFKASFVGRDDNPVNDEVTAVTVSRGRPRVLIIQETEADARYFKRALAGERIDVEVRGSEGLPRTLTGFLKYELVILGDVPAYRLGRERMDVLERYVKAFGGGLFMFGGENAFQLGGYEDRGLGRLLPLKAESTKRKDDNSVALVLVIDRSGSMKGVKIEMAKVAAVKAIKYLTNKDYLGVIAFDSHSRWVVQLSPVFSKSTLRSRVRTINARGGTSLYPALELAQEALRRSPAKIKHVIALSDGHSTPGDFISLVSRMARTRITVSTVGVGAGANRLMREIAQWGRGRFYEVTDPYSIPSIFMKETSHIAKRAIREEPAAARPADASHVLRGINFDDAPYLTGYVAAKAKPSARVLLRTNNGRPLLAVWRYGLGQVGAYTSNVTERWAAMWLEWDSFGRFWANIVRHVMRRSRLRDTNVRFRREGKEAVLRFDNYTPDRRFRDRVRTRITMKGPYGSRRFGAVQVSPGRYEARFPLQGRGVYHFHVRQYHESRLINRFQLGYVVNYPREFSLQPADSALLEELSRISGGRFSPEAAEVFRPIRKSRTSERPFFIPLLIGAVVLLFLDVLVRRVDWRLLRRS